jgi:hypothetical protein
MLCFWYFLFPLFTVRITKFTVRITKFTVRITNFTVRITKFTVRITNFTVRITKFAVRISMEVEENWPRVPDGRLIPRETDRLTVGGNIN